jgi:hypothetical protein
MTLDSVVCVRSGQLASPVGDEMALLSLDAGAYYGLNAAGARIWQQLQKPIAVEALVQGLLAVYEVEPDTCRRDVLELLERMQQAGLIEVVPGHVDPIAAPRPG